MKLFCLISICLSITCGVWAQLPAQPSAEPAKINLDVKDSPLKTVIEGLFKGSGKNFTLDPALNAPPYDKITVSMTLRDVTFDEALKSLIKAHNLAYRKEGDVYVISPRPSTVSSPTQSQPGFNERLVSLELRDTPVRVAIDSLFKGTGLNYAIEPGVTGTIPNLSLKDVTFDQALKTITIAAGLTYRKDGQVYLIGVRPHAPKESDQITTVIPAMPIKEALLLLDKATEEYGRVIPTNWQFKGDLGSTIMPGARFYKFPRGMAVRMLFAASGLIAPTGPDKPVTSRGVTNLYNLFLRDTSVNSINTRESGGYVASGYIRELEKDQSNVSMGAYKAGGRWMFSIIASQAFDIDLLEKLFQMAGVNYVIGDRGPVGAVKTLSVQLVDVTLDQALSFTLPSLGLTHRKDGTPTSPAYVISRATTGTQPTMKPLPAKK